MKALTKKELRTKRLLRYGPTTVSFTVASNAVGHQDTPNAREPT